MLVRFNSSTAGEMLMFAGNARDLLHVLHKEALQRGVITLEQLPEAIARLEQALDAAKAQEAADRLQPEHGDEDTGDRAVIPPGPIQRIPPFLDYLRRTLKEDGYVMWEAPADFTQAACA